VQRAAMVVQERATTDQLQVVEVAHQRLGHEIRGFGSGH
jgi:hypothetical protein